MKLSKLNIKRIKLSDISKDYTGQDILLKLGELYQFESGIYGYGNLWTKLERNVENIIISELDKNDCIQVEFPKLQPRSIWDKSGRWETYTTKNDIMFNLNNNLGEYGLAPTAEECAALFGANRLGSYKNLPTTYYQIGEKFRKEIRTRGYLFRPRTFVMMDAYSFDKTEEDMHRTYNKMHEVYLNIFEKLGIKIIPTISDNGTMGGKVSEEFQAITKFGEDKILYDEVNDIGINKEVLEFENSEEYTSKIKDINLLKEYSSIELGNNFELGTFYSDSMKLYYKDEFGHDKPYYMGCYGIGLGRIIATIIENSVIIEDGILKGFSLPFNVAPYKVHIIYKEDKKIIADNVYNSLIDKGIEAIIDDRCDYSFGSKIKDAYVLGSPYVLILGDKTSESEAELENTKTHEKQIINLNDIESYLK